MPTDLEFSVLEKYVIVMKPLVSITEAIGAEKWVTISLLRPLLHKLIHMHLAETSGDSIIERSLKNAVLSDLQHRYVEYFYITKAAFLDPRFKMLSFINTNNREEVVKEIKEEAVELAKSMAAEDNTNSTLSNQGVVKQLKGENKLINFSVMLFKVVVAQKMGNYVSLLTRKPVWKSADTVER